MFSNLRTILLILLSLDYARLHLRPVLRSQLVKRWTARAQTKLHKKLQMFLDFLGVPPTPLSELDEYSLHNIVPIQCLTGLDVDNAVTAIYASLPQVPARRFVSIDIEWASGGNGSNHRVDLIQLAVQNQVYLVRTHSTLSDLPPTLAQLLGDGTVMKISAGINGDAVRIKRKFCTSVRSCVDLTDWARVVFPEVWPKNPTWSQLLLNPRLWFQHPTPTVKLEKIVGEVLRLNVKKSSEVTMSDWAANELSAAQIQYAAIDVHSTFAVALALSQSHPPLPDKYIKNFEA